MMTTARKGATRAADIPADVLQALSHGKIQAATLAEGIALDQKQLIRAVFPDLPQPVLQDIDAACELGILKRMGRIGAVLLDTLGTEGIETCQVHESDTVRGWACFMVGAQVGLTIPERLAAISPFADDAHFGVREWAWMALRPHLVAELSVAINNLVPWTTLPSERLRRFACEVLRPRGVWCTHIAALKSEPALALPILSPLRADSAIYVQDSVANWLNDAAKDQPDWVRALCEQWLQLESAESTRRICQRAMRNLK
jgi:3-methyladenine DNA glycosylase AlkC